MSATALEVPLFPLNLVLFPGTVSPLHIFEMRYRQMILDCQRENRPFGMVLARPESEHLNEQPYPVGTMVDISNLTRLEDGRYTFMAVGTKRFRIVSQHRNRPYLSGLVEPFEDIAESESELSTLKQQAYSLFSEYLGMLLEASDGNKNIDANLPDAPEDLSHFIAYFLDIQEERKQYFLELTSTHQRLQEEIAILRREVPFMRQILSRDIPDELTRLN
ncbi:MAG: LON peptidase substrate-binding domain-containing protein [Ktedonobacteraceae bacterium]|nr:LON peptidase substrate-binding domain-containing protein [Ktedonobacteraceae bacterium]